MNNCIILGCGRSGTSLTAGILASSGYFMGEDLYPARDSNPKGFFESPDINGINEQILAQIPFNSTHKFRKYFEKYELSYGQRWLERVPFGTPIPSTDGIVQMISEITKRQPFCFKDPRFSYTLPVWKPYFHNTVYICVFRAPAITAASIVKECRSEEYLRSVPMSYKIAIEIWTLMYKHIVEYYSNSRDWLFLHYDQILNFDGVEKIQNITGAQVDARFPESSLSRSQSESNVPLGTKELYNRLCELAEYKA